MRWPTSGKKWMTILAAISLLGVSACGDDDDGGGGGGGDVQVDAGDVGPDVSPDGGDGGDGGMGPDGGMGQCDGVTCDQPEASCDANTAVTYSGAGVCDPADGSCDYSGVETRTNCTDADKVCVDGACVLDAGDMCDGVTCDQPDNTCDGDTAVTYSDAGVCDPADGSCDYSSVETRTDCTEDDQVCMNGACVPEGTDPCDTVSCDQPADTCDGDTAVTYSGAGMCDTADGSCDYSSVETRTDCTEDDQVCMDGACVEPTTDPCDGVTCDQPEDTCDGDTAVTYSGAGMCDSTDGSCDYSTVETRTDCTDTSEVCVDGACAAPDGSVNPGDLVITELIQNPDAVGDTEGEWFEVYNTTGRTLQLDGLTVKDEGSNSFTVSATGGTSVEVSPNSYFVFARNGDMSANGGVNADYEYGDVMSLANGGDEVIILNGTDEIDRIEYDGGPDWPDPTGASMQFGSENAFTDDNNIADNWCVSVDPIDTTGSAGSSDLGTPGAANSRCTFPPVTITIYDLQDPDAPDHPMVNQSVVIEGVMATAVGTDEMWVQEFAGGKRSGTYVDTSGVSTAVSRGQTVDLEGTYTEANGVTTVVATSVQTSLTSPPVTLNELDAATLSDPATAEAWEGVLVTLAEPAVTNENPDGPNRDFDEFRVDDGIRVDNQLYDYPGDSIDPTACDTFDSITGVVDYSFGNYKVLPRDTADMAAPTMVNSQGASAGVTILPAVGFSPADVCVDINATVTWTNNAGSAQTVTERNPVTDDAATNPTFDKMLDAAVGSTAAVIIPIPGTFHYLSTDDPSLMGRVIVAE